MITVVSESISKWLEKEGTISSIDHTLFSYAVFSCLWGGFPLGITLVLGKLEGMLLEGIFLILPYMSLRKFSGGYHLSSAKLCIIFTATLLVAAFKLIKIILSIESTLWLTISVALSIVSLCIFSPIDSKGRELSKTEIITFKKMSRVIAIIALFSYLALLCNADLRYSVSFGVGILIPALSQIPCLFHNITKKKLRKGVSEHAVFERI